jgi:hypothetical protein
MFLIKSFRSTIALFCLSAPLWVGIAPPPAQALPQAPFQISLDFKVPDRGVAGTTAGGGTRGRCLPDTKVPISLIPKTNLGLTVSDRPSFFAYIPPLSQTASQAPHRADFLLLGNDDQAVVYQASFDLPQKSGVVRYDLPADAPALKPGSRYHWYITLSCTTAVGPSPSAEGWVERVTLAPNLTKALKASEPSKRLALYAEAGIWHETLTLLADLQRQAPSNQAVKSDWRSLLKSVGLESIAQEPIVHLAPPAPSQPVTR